MIEPAHWSLDTSEVDRLLDGELTESERVERDAEVASDAEVARRVAGRRAFLAALSRAARPAGAVAAPELGALERRVRAALARDRARAGTAAPRRIPAWSWVAATAAVLLLGLGILRFGPSLRVADATPPEALLAADLVRTAPGTADGGATCGVQQPTSPFRLRLVERREMAVKLCIDAKDDEPSGAPEQALLYRVADLDLVGYVAVPNRGAKLEHEIGVTRLDDVVVFDVRQGGALYWLAVRREVVDRRGSCAACHGRSREGEKSPHRFRERRGPAPRS